MFFSLKTLTDPALKRLYKFLLKRVLGRFLLHELDLSQLQVHLRQGTLHLVELELNSNAINELLATAGLPFQMKRGFLGSVKVTVSYTNFLNESCLVAIQDVDIVLEPLSTNPSPSTESKNFTTETPSNIPKTTNPSLVPNDYEVDAVSQEGLDFVATWIERVTSKIKITVSNLCVTLEDSMNCPVALMLRVPWMQLVDETPQEAYPSTTILKGIQCKGICIELVHLHRDSIDETATPYSVVPILVCDTEQPSYLQFKISPAMIEMDFFVPMIQILLQPKQVAQLNQLAELFSSSPTHIDPNPLPLLNMQASICEPHVAASWCDTDGDDVSGFPLSLTEFQRIERLLQQYQQNKQLTTSTLLHHNSSLADSIDSTGLSDLEDDQFFDCEDAQSSMAQSMYMSARQPTAAEETMIQRVKIHLLQVEATILYEDLMEEDIVASRTGLPEISRMERLVWNFRDVLLQAILHEPHPKNVHISMHHVSCEERLIPRLSVSSLDDDTEGDMISTQLVWFVGDEKDIVIHLYLDPLGPSSCILHAQPLHVEVDMFMLNRLQVAYFNAPSKPSTPPTTEIPCQIELHVPFVHFNLRFPLIPSDPIRFGPSSRRGLAEDTLQFHFQNVKFGADTITWSHMHMELEYPPGFNPREARRLMASICTSDANGHCSWRMQSPTHDVLQEAMTVKSNMKETFGSDAEHGEVSTADGLDAWRQTELLEEACIAASLTVARIHIPDASMCIEKPIYDRLMILTAALFTINPVDITGLAKVIAIQPCQMSLEIVCDSFHVRFHDVDIPIYRLELEHVRIFSLSSWLGSLTSRLHIVAQELTLFEGDIPVLYKIAWGRPHSGPLLLFLQETTELAEDMGDISLQLHFSHLTWRYDMNSNWLGDYLNILLTTYPPAIVPLDTPHSDIYDANQIPIPLAMPSKTVFTKLVVQCYQAVLDYAPPDISARALLVLGKLSLSSNLVTDATVQGYKLNANDLSLFVHPLRYDNVYQMENEWLNKKRPRETMSMQETIENMGFLQVSTLDFADIFIRLSEDQMNLELCLGTIKLKVCFDSFETMNLILSTWWEEFSKNTPSDEKIKNPIQVGEMVTQGEINPPLLNIMEEIDFQMFKPTTSSIMRDTEARILQTQVHEAKKPMTGKKRIPSTPLVIDDFFGDVKSPQTETRDSPWFISKPNQPERVTSPSLVGSPAMHGEASARWIPPEPEESLKVDSSFKAVEDDEEDDYYGDENTDVTMSVSINDTEEVELDMHLDGEMRSELDRLLQVDDGGFMSEDEDGSPRSSVLSPPDSPTTNSNSARWYNDEHNEPPPIYLHHVEIPIAGAAAALSFGEKELAFAIQTMTNECPNMKTPVMVKSILLRDFNVEMRLFGGHDWNTNSNSIPSVKTPSPSPSKNNIITEKSEKKKKLLDSLLENYIDDTDKSIKNTSKSRPSKHRKTEEMLELRLSNIKLRLDLYGEAIPQPLAQNIVLHIGDIEILDYISTSQIRKLLCYWKSDTFHPRETGTPLFHFHLITVRSCGMEEHRLKLKFLPLRINLDQDVLDFLKQFKQKEIKKINEEIIQELPIELHAPTIITEKNNLNEISPNSFFFQNIDIRSFKIKIDYRPQRVDFQALKAGDYLEVINFFVLEGMELSLRHIKLSGVDGWDALINQTLVHWVQDISRHQIHKCLASVVPMRSITNIGAGAADLILLPMAQYGRDRRVVRGIRKGAKSFLRSVTIETLNTASKLARGTKSLLETADHVIQDSKKKKTHFNSRKGNTHARYLMSQPANATEGMNQAYESMSRELHVVAKTIVAVPLLEYQRTGPHGYVKSVIRAVPVAVLRPMIGATEAVSRALIGVRNAVDPEMKEDMENKFKDMS